jgi:hypothetical protein
MLFFVAFFYRVLTDFGSNSDTVSNKSLQFCLEMVDFYVEEQIKEELDVEFLNTPDRKEIINTMLN